MRTIETKAMVTADGEMTVQLPLDIQPGEHSVVVVIEEQPVEQLIPVKKLNGDELRAALEANSWNWTNWAADAKFTREEIYYDDDDDGR